jgi:hypothetical protein
VVDVQQVRVGGRINKSVGRYRRRMEDMIGIMIDEWIEEME